jgi:hypothetical protein
VGLPGDQGAGECRRLRVKVEVIPAELFAEITKRTSRLTSSIGAGSSGDIQFLFAEEILGNNPPPYPRHSKQYRHLYKLKQEMQVERVSGFKEFIDDVQQHRFPGPGHVIKAPGGLIGACVDTVDASDGPLAAGAQSTRTDRIRPASSHDSAGTPLFSATHGFQRETGNQ